MEQSVITLDETLAVIVAKAEAVVERELTAMEKVMMEFAVEQIRLGLV
jgi:hypothetical protein